MAFGTFNSLVQRALASKSTSEWISFLEFFDLRSALQLLLQDHAALNKIALDSYQHANGFTKIVLTQVQGVTLRLHLWIGSRPLIKGDHEKIHSHKWDFTSRILFGTLCYENYALTADGEPFFQYVSSVRRNVGGYPLSQLGVRRLSLDGAGSLATGTTYFTDGRKLHRVFPGPEGITATLLLQSPHKYPEYQVFSSDAIPASDWVETESLSIAELKDAIQFVVDRL